MVFLNQAILYGPGKLFSQLLSLSLATCIVLELHVKIQTSLRAVVFGAAVVRAVKLLLNFIGTSPEVLLSAAHVPLVVVLRIRSLVMLVLNLLA